MSESRVAIITGSSRGIGRAAAELLADRGWAVVISSRNQDSCEAVARAIRDAGGDALAVACHIGREEQLAALVEKTVEHYGRLDAVVMNAASNPVYGPSDNVDLEAFDVIMHNNVYGSMRLAHLARPHLARSGQAAVVLVSSIAGQFGNKLIGAYGLSKAAENQLVRNLALELGPDGIRVNAVAPGLVKTDFAQALLENERMVKYFETTTPLRRLAEPEDIGRIITFLAGEDSGWLSGQVITADGGLSVTGGF
ncbi:MULTISPECIES: SDR family NAD(P)-dependent oxidoreductase [unclassified Wenzhouxiangella]|uniref:SDR family NAD(P)-dependent oxidoreductase n=1 Tax=unclassified Wenzhouxiangella TaxID=2613841 RepID=UPI000E32BCCF|nr:MULTISPECIES: SDR family oxidoreductase [unclassified Wenzhouxiangella]RFF26745.1 SDR family oxidoreductase [Wenzhouxiangella sp. 15181]RFP68923.1 SDR family oxidoreductase [Wenzhouxiangella sp. 15190]